MVTTAEVGHSWDKSRDSVRILMDTSDENSLALVKDFLEEQPESYAHLWTLEEILQLVQQGHLLCWIYYRDDKALGIVLTTINHYSSTVTSIKIEFGTCKNFFKMTSMIDCIEIKAAELGYTMIEAMAHPAIATYAVHKKGFTAPGVYIRKFIQNSRRN